MIAGALRAAPRQTVEEATSLLDEHGDEAMRLRRHRAAAAREDGLRIVRDLVDTKAIGELAGIREDGDTLVVGATVTHRQIERSPLVLQRLPALAAMERQVANVRVRTVGTLAGNLCFSDPHSDPATFLLALDAEIESRRGDGSTRRRPLRDFLGGPYEPVLEHGELVLSVRVRVPQAGTSIVHRKFAFHERPAATVSCAVRVSDGAIADARIAVGSVGNVAVRASEAETLIVGTTAGDEQALAAAGAKAAAMSGPVEDANGSAEYKAHLVEVMVVRALREALRAA